MQAALAMFALALVAACGDTGPPAASSHGSAGRPTAALPAPATSAGSVTGMPDAPGPGSAATIAALPEPLEAAATADPMLLEANPESGLQDPFAGPFDAGEPLAAADGTGGTGPEVPTAGRGDEASAAETIRRYYGALDAGDFAAAHGLWRDGGSGSGQTLEQFRTGFARTVAFRVQTGKATWLDAGGSPQRIEVPVSLATTDRDGRERRSIGRYLLQRSVTDATDGWHIASADLRELER